MGTKEDEAVPAIIAEVIDIHHGVMGKLICTTANQTNRINELEDAAAEQAKEIAALTLCIAELRGGRYE